MKKLVFSVLACVALNVHAQNFNWAGHYVSTDPSGTVGVCRTNSGNVVLGGNFSPSIDLDPSGGSFVVNSNGGYDAFVTILNSSGGFVNGFNLGGPTMDYLGDVAVNTAGEIYVTGRFTGTNVDFDPGAGSSLLSSSVSNTYDAFIAKYDAAGNFLWSRQLGGAGHEMARSLAVDGSGNVVAIGEYGGTIDLDPTAGTYNVTAAGDRDIYIVKLSSTGGFMWGGSIGGTMGDMASAVSIDGSGGICVGGGFMGSIDLDPSSGNYSLTGPGGMDCFIVRLLASGTLDWAGTYGGNTGDDEIEDVFCSAGGEVLITGGFIQGADLNPTGTALNVTAVGDRDIYCIKLDVAGDFVWAKSMGSPVSDKGMAVVANATNDVYISGYFNQQVDFDPGAGVQTLTSAPGHVDGFVLKLDAMGNFSDVTQLNGTGDVSGWALDHGGNNLYCAGQYGGTMDFDPTGGTYNLTNSVFSGVAFLFNWQY